ncbi:hypothetical protein FQN52_000352 [Onygenales sp. PD_12]|nr:hypothetical protein FQN52_000352 [Onygenales sp. PD_12]
MFPVPAPVLAAPPRPPDTATPHAFAFRNRKYATTPAFCQDSAKPLPIVRATAPGWLTTTTYPRSGVSFAPITKPMRYAGSQLAVISLGQTAFLEPKLVVWDREMSSTCIIFNANKAHNLVYDFYNNDNIFFQADMIKSQDKCPQVNIQPQIGFRNFTEMVTKLGFAVVDGHEHE